MSIHSILEDLVEQQQEQGDWTMSFNFMGIDVTNPFMDETGRFAVNPFSYYGDYFLESEILSVAKGIFDNNELPCMACLHYGCDGTCAK